MTIRSETLTFCDTYIMCYKHLITRHFVTLSFCDLTLCSCTTHSDLPTLTPLHFNNFLSAFDYGSLTPIGTLIQKSGSWNGATEDLQRHTKSSRRRLFFSCTCSESFNTQDDGCDHRYLNKSTAPHLSGETVDLHYF
jgi:hypothetical protein